MAQAKHNADPHGLPRPWLGQESGLGQELGQELRLGQGLGQEAPHAPIGNPIAQLQADIARRLTGAFDERPHLVSPTDRAVQLLSAAGGYAGLAAGYAIAALGVVYWLRS